MIAKVERIQQSIAEYLRTREALRGVRIITDRSTDIEGKIDEKTTPKLDLSITVRAPSLATASTGGATIIFPNVTVKIRVTENLLTNTTGMSAAYVAERVVKELNLYTPDGATDPIVPRNDYPWFPLAGSTTTNGIDLTFVTAMTL